MLTQINYFCLSALFYSCIFATEKVNQTIKPKIYDFRRVSRTNEN